MRARTKGKYCFAIVIGAAKRPSLLHLIYQKRNELVRFDLSFHAAPPAGAQNKIGISIFQQLTERNAENEFGKL